MLAWIIGLTMSAMAGISGRGRDEITRGLDGRRFVTPSELAANLGISQDRAAEKLGAWARDGWVRRVRRGLYIGVPVDAPDPVSWSEDALIVADQVWRPCYFTGWTAARHWGMTEQVFRTTVLKSTTRVRSSNVRLLDHDYLLVHCATEALTWGTASEWRDGVRLLMADPARTVVDVLDRPRLGGGIRHGAEILVGYFEDHDADSLVAAAERFGSGSVFKRLGYLAETLSLGDRGLIEACQERLTAGVSPLDPSGPAGGRRIMRWGLRLNVSVTDEGAS